MVLHCVSAQLIAWEVSISPNLDLALRVGTRATGRKQRKVSVDGRVQSMNGGRKVRDQAAMSEREWVKSSYLRPSCPMSSISERLSWTVSTVCTLYRPSCLSGVHVPVYVPVSLCVRDKERAWFGLSSLKPKELLFWNASWIVLMIFFLPAGSQLYQAHGHIWTVSPGSKNSGPWPSL